jgi:hypothetical protein
LPCGIAKVAAGLQQCIFVLCSNLHLTKHLQFLASMPLASILSISYQVRASVVVRMVLSSWEMDLVLTSAARCFCAGSGIFGNSQNWGQQYVNRVQQRIGLLSLGTLNYHFAISSQYGQCASTRPAQDFLSCTPLETLQ